MSNRADKEPRSALVVDDEQSSRFNVRELLRLEGFDVDEAEDGLQALARVTQRVYDVILLDIRMPKVDGLSVLKKLQQSHPQIPVIVFTAFGTSEKAIEAMKLGAYDYLTKPFDIDELLTVVQRAVKYRRLSDEVTVLRQRLAEAEAGEFQPDQIISTSKAMQRIFKIIGKVAPSDATVLIEGETGTGKELVANALWYHSHRRNAPFVKINCAAIPETLLESELFGHEKGAFTGAETQRKGRFELAHGGTIFLDEISEMSPSLQSKLLRVLEQSEFQRVGGRETIRVNVRILAATNRNLEEEVRLKRFRKDLFYRLQVVHLVLPPLRERKEDIPPLVDHFLRKYGGRRRLITDSETVKALTSYSWPGNVRELENILQRATVLAQGKHITLEHIALPLVHEGLHPTPSLSGSLREILQSVERDVILKTLKSTGWNRSKAAAALKIDRRVLFEKIKKYGLKE